jgi:hypothetical protein
MDAFLAVDIGGLHVPNAGPMFFTALGVHVVAGATSVVAGLLAATARKRPGRHPRAGRVFLYGIGVVFATATIMATLRWRQDWQLFIIAAVAFGVALIGWWARRRRPRRWMVWHGSAMACSYVALFTGFYVDNGPQLPLWDRLPHLTYWLLPAAIGAPLTWWALRRNGALDRGSEHGARSTPTPGQAGRLTRTRP